MNESRHALVVGGTGMLRDASLRLARDGWIVSMIARSREHLDAVARMSAREGRADGGAAVNPIPLDYHDSAALRTAIQSAIASHGPIVLVLAWIHSTAPQAPRILAETIAESSRSKPFRFIHVLGSELDDPRQGKPPQQHLMERIPHMRYQRVILGFVPGGGGDGASRWLTDDEICRGVEHAIEGEQPESIVGVLEPWDRRP